MDPVVEAEVDPVVEIEVAAIKDIFDLLNVINRMTCIIVFSAYAFFSQIRYLVYQQVRHLETVMN